MIMHETFTLTNGVKIPKLGLGMWMVEPDKAADVVAQAIKLGYRHIDTAQAYQNEAGVGAGVRASGINRADIFITTKLDANIKSYKEALSAIDQSLHTMQLDYLDLMLIHSPQPWIDYGGDDRFFEGNTNAWRAMEDAYKAGKLRAIGVSNFNVIDIENIMKTSSVKPTVNQILAHVGNTPFDLITYLQSKDILIEAYSPIGHGAMLNNTELSAIADKYMVSVAQLCIRYCLQLDLLPLPKSANTAHIRTNAAVDFAISEQDMARLKKMHALNDYGEANVFPVYGGKMHADGSFSAGK
jgi:diketogulonate reductase-like aldo/keto reductase